MKTFTQPELAEILEKHRKWLRNEEGGGRANLRGSDLSLSDLRGSNLRGSDLSFSDLRGSYLSFSDLRGSDLSGSNLSFSDLSFSDLSGSDLSGSNLSGSNLRGSNLRGSNGNAAQIKSLYLETYPIAYTAEYLQIGCERHPITDWWSFDDARIAKMEGAKALEFWGKWKAILRQIIKMSPATPTGHETKPEDAA